MLHHTLVSFSAFFFAVVSFPSVLSSFASAESSPLRLIPFRRFEKIHLPNQDNRVYIDGDALQNKFHVAFRGDAKQFEKDGRVEDIPDGKVEDKDDRPLWGTTQVFKGDSLGFKINLDPEIETRRAMKTEGISSGKDDEVDDRPVWSA